MAMPGLRAFVVAATVAATGAGSLALAPRPAAAHEGPSFDCTAAMTAIENMICQDGQLSGFDLELDRLYRAQLKAARQAGAERVRRLKAEQSAWLAERNACEAYKCVVAVYERRIDALEGR
ncbi:MAG TPA: lysozyme inhibitor LprI family protein [Caulobacteraceae bacterium]|nr:lysozyme inhibitor LprI family protein [Caulobacteraceae bacterium]